MRQKGEGDAKNSNNARVVFSTVSSSFKPEPSVGNPGKKPRNFRIGIFLSKLPN